MIQEAKILDTPYLHIYIISSFSYSSLKFWDCYFASKKWRYWDNACRKNTFEFILVYDNNGIT
jgi:hypothetical protein